MAYLPILFCLVELSFLFLFHLMVNSIPTDHSHSTSAKDPSIVLPPYPVHSPIASIILLSRFGCYFRQHWIQFQSSDAEFAAIIYLYLDEVLGYSLARNLVGCGHRNKG